MLNKNNLITGLLAGMVFPAIAWVVFGCLFPSVTILNKPLTPYFIAIALNLLILRICFAKNAGKTGTGVMVITFVLLLALCIFKLKPAA